MHAAAKMICLLMLTLLSRINGESDAMIISESAPNKNEMKSLSVNLKNGFTMTGAPIRGMIDLSSDIEGITMNKAIASELILMGD